MRRAIGTLEELRRLDATTGMLLNDLAAAYFASASWTGNSRDFVRALDAIERAALLDSASEVIAFNRALILQSASLQDAARESWSAFEQSYPTSAWRSEARARNAAMDAGSTPSFADLATNGISSDHVRKDPQGAREYALGPLLRSWGAEIGAGRLDRADSALTLTRFIGRTLLEVVGDSTVLLASSECAANGTAMGEMVVRLYDAIRRFERRETNTARALLDLASHSSGKLRAPSTRQWISLYQGATELTSGQYLSAEARFIEIARWAAAHRAIALHARAQWALGLSRARRQSLGTSEESYLAARELFRRISESANVAAIESQLADVYSAMGRSRSALDADVAVLRARSSSRAASARPANLISAGSHARDNGYAFAAVAILDEALRLAEKTEYPEEVIEAGTYLAQALSAIDRRPRASAVLSRVRAQLDLVADPTTRARLSADIATAEAMVVTAGEPMIARNLLDQAAGVFERQLNQYKLLPILTKRSTLNLLLGDTTRALNDLGTAIDLASSFLKELSDPIARRSALGEQRRARLILANLAVVRHDTGAAFALADEARRAGRIEHRGSVSDVAPSQSRESEAIVTYDVLSNAVLVRVDRGARSHRAIIAVSDTTIARLARELDQLARSAQTLGELESVSREFSSYLIMPIERQLAGARGLIVAPAEELASVPFGLLLFERRVLSSRFALRFASSRDRAVDALAMSPFASTGRSALIVGDPAFDERQFPTLQRLASARREASAIDSLYPRALVVSGEEATRTRLIPLLAKYDVLHLAGHARIVEGMPDESHLVLAPSTAGGGASVLYAREIRNQDLRNVYLVVLSSCGTADADEDAAASARGLAQAFLDAGVRTVVASLWEADDDMTSRIMVAFHKALKRGLAPSFALSEALRATSVAETEPPARWAGFRVEGW